MTSLAQRPAGRLAPTRSPGWSPLGLFLIRRTGFPIELLEELSSPEIAAALGARQRAAASLGAERAAFERQFAAAVAEAERAGADRQALRRLYRLGRAVSRPGGRPQEADLPERGVLASWSQSWREASARAAAADARLTEVVAAEDARTRAALVRAARDPRVAEAVRRSNPGGHERVIARLAASEGTTRANSRTRQAERFVYAYVQRLCAKNESTSFFGPVDYGRITGPDAPALVLERAPGTLLDRRTSMAHWAVQALADAVAQDPAVRPQLAPRLAPAWSLDRSETLLGVLTGKRRSLAPEAARALAQCDGSQPLRAFNSAPQTALEPLLADGSVELALRVPTALDDPLRWLQDWVGGLPPVAGLPRWAEALDELARGVWELGAASGDERAQWLAQVEASFERIADVPARRAEGRMYADRLLVSEQCRGDIRDCRVGGSLAERLSSALQLPLTLCASYSTVLRDDLQAQALALIGALAPTGRLPFLAFVAAFDRAVSVAQSAGLRAPDAWRRELDRLVRVATGAGHCRLGACDVEALLRPIPPGTWASPDVFLVARDVAQMRADPAAVGVVVGEIHHGHQVWTHLASMAPERDAIAAELAASGAATLVHRRTQGMAFERDLLGVDIEVMGRSTGAAGRTVRAGDLDVAIDGSELALVQRRSGERFVLRARDPRSPSNWLLGALPVVVPPLLSEEPQRPRVVVGDAVLWRRAWRIAPGGVGELAAASGPDTRTLAADSLRAEHGLPERCFAQVAGERKPFYVDFTSLPAIDHLAHIARKAPAVTFTELLPEPSRWWLRDERGTFSCEWRLSFAMTR